MKRNNIFFALAVFAVCSFFRLQAQIELADPIIHLQSIASAGPLYFLNDSIAVTARKTTGNGNDIGYISYLNISSQTWSHSAKLPDNLNFSRIAMADSLEGVFMSGNGIYFTTDGGKTITQATIPFSTTQAQGGRDVYKTSGGYLAHFTFPANTHHLYHSVDGVTWTFSGSLGGFTGASIIGDTIYYATGNSIRISPDGGQTFPNSNYVPNIPVNLTYFHAVNHSLFFAGNATNNYVFTNKGATREDASLTAGAPIVGAAFKNAEEGILYQGVNGGFFYTTDGGTTWIQGTKAPVVQQGIYFFVGDKLFSSTASYANLHYTHDWGQNWEGPIFSNISMASVLDISFYGNLGVLVGTNGSFEISYNGGYHFHKGSQDGITQSQHFTACTVLNDTTILIGNFRGEVWRSTNRGVSWTKVFANAQNNRLLRFKHLPNGLVLGTRNLTVGGIPLISTDYGATFTARGIGDMVEPYVDGSIIQTSSGKVYSRSGSNFNTSAELASITWGAFEPFDIKMASGNVGYLFGKEGTERLVSYRTEDGGNNWRRQAGVYEDVINFELLGSKIQTFGEQKIAIAQANAITDVSTHNKLFLSNSGGEEWTEYTLQNPGGLSAHNFTLKSVHFFDTDKYIAGMNNGNLLLNAFASEGVDSSDPEGAITSIMENKNSAGLNYAFTIYPNPATTQLSVNLTGIITAGYGATISITDVSGRTVFEQLLPANYSENVFMVNTEHLQNGIFLFSVKTAGTILNKRLIIK